MLALTQFIASIKEVRVSLVKSLSVFSSSISTVHQFSSVLIHSFIYLSVTIDYSFISYFFITKLLYKVLRVKY